MAGSSGASWGLRAGPRRILFYDATPSSESVQTPFGGPRIDLGTSVAHARNVSLHARLAREDYFALRLGDLAVRGWKPRSRLHNCKGNVDVIVLVTADSDFIPAMKFARREGAQLMLVTLGNPVSQHMLDHADIALTMPFQETL